jgi:hypothetical protein
MFCEMHGQHKQDGKLSEQQEQNRQRDCNKIKEKNKAFDFVAKKEKRNRKTPTDYSPLTHVEASEKTTTRGDDFT